MWLGTQTPKEVRDVGGGSQGSGRALTGQQCLSYLRITGDTCVPCLPLGQPRITLWRVLENNVYRELMS